MAEMGQSRRFDPQIDFEIYPHDWDGTSRVFSGCQSPSASRENHLNFEVCKFKCEFREKFGLVVR
jgi:hypothetical protein